MDLVLLDIDTDLSGYDILGRNRDLLQSKNIPVIVVSSLDEQKPFTDVWNLGHRLPRKPVNFMILAARINSALERKYLDREEEHLRRIEAEQHKMKSCC